jgi:hypothetical protein
MYSKEASFPCSQGKAHNCLVLIRWLESKCAQTKGVSPYDKLRWQTVWAWVELFEICLTAADPDCSAAEMQRFDSATAILLHGPKTLGTINALKHSVRWRIRPKLHVFYHLNKDVQASCRNPRAWWTFKDEEFMGKMARIACAVHAVTMCSRSLERWCVQFFASMES